MAAMTCNAINNSRITKIGTKIITNYKPRVEVIRFDKNEYLSIYFEQQAKNTDNKFKKSHFEKVSDLLKYSIVDIRDKKDFEEILCGEGGYKNPKGLLAHYEYAIQII